MEDKNKTQLYIELGANLTSDKPVRNIVKPYSDQVIEDFRKEHENKDIFSTIYQYDSEKTREAKQIAPLYFDFDGELAKEDLNAVIEFLKEQGCPSNSLQPYFSGRGFHLEIAWKSLGIEAHKNLNHIYKHIVESIDKEVYVSTLDTKVYDNVRLWRISNSINSKSGLYKIPLSLDEIKLPIEDIKELAKNPRYNFEFPEVTKWNNFQDSFKEASKLALKRAKKGIFEPVGEGNRNDTTFKRAIKLKAEGKSIDEALAICLEIEDEPQLPESEIKRTVFSAYQDKYKVDQEENNNDSQSVQVLKSVSDSGAILFHDQFNIGYIAPKGDGSQIFKIKSKVCERWLTHLYWTSTESVLSPTVLNSITQLLDAKSIHSGDQYQLFNRVASKDGYIWYDLGNGNVIRVDASGWEVIDTPPILFRRFSHQKIQVKPLSGGDIKEVLDFVNLSNLDNGLFSYEQILLLCWIVFSFIPDRPHPAPILAGPQGSNKSTFQKVLKELIDPSSVQIQATPNGLNEFIQVASHNWLLILDNLSHLPEWLSDAICRVITGGGFTKRELYSDDTDVIYDFRHVVGINGINLVVEKADLLDRSLIFNLKRSKKFIKEDIFWKEFEERKPYILGGIFNVLVKTLKLIKTAPELEENFRMADFAHWGSAIAQALGLESKDFIEAYKANVSRQNQEALDASPIAIVLLEFMSDKDSWIGTPTDLLSELEKLTEKLHINEKHRFWPKDARWVWRRINEILPNLEAENIKATQSRDKQRIITLQKSIGTNDNTDNNSSIDENITDEDLPF